ncbi:MULTISPECIES: hypothetical protein [Bacillus cereus group]|uniref:Uncharacterized protein n=1 Tax=Bacillus cereus TaxID=1396 RepID=A0A2B1DGH6_BACCE|nr:hypothetical protein [Bacillus cereus]PDY84297.1 hypothetical protein CON06_02580 [Bacillus cereus]PFA07181.1 hypothetical protein CN382_25325 [Bacillus cereus]PFM38319.1 hypothetical protein COJ43_19095 [Bacillus cereus]PGL58315.1 hypothetical protein CN927_23005 [Bacillus cereus]PGQ05433.1 hypothetical protein COA08_26380 [Bacillus cereus]
MPYLIRDEGLVLQGDNGKEPVFHTYEEAAETLKTLTIPQFPKHIRKKTFKPKIKQIADSE